jgi:putative ABC transport system permease protein
MAEPLIGDLEQTFHEKVAGLGAAAARRWFWREALRAPLAFPRKEFTAVGQPDSEGDGPMRNLFTDLRLALRLMWRRPGFTALAVGTLALGIGATAGVFSLVNGILLRSLPYPDPDRLVRIFETAPPAQGGELRSIAIPTLAHWRRDLRLFEGIALYGPETFDVSGGAKPEQIRGATTSTALFTLLGGEPLLGRAFSDEEERPGGPLVTVLSHRLWQRRFGGDSAIIGQTIRLNRQAFTVIGVAPPGFNYPADAELWAPLGTDHEYDAAAARHMSALGRIRPGVTFSEAAAELLAEERRLAELEPRLFAGFGIKLIPLSERIVGGVRPALIILAGAVTLVLLIACVNVASLLLAGAAVRRRELAVRMALGASRSQLVRQLLAEALVLFVAAGGLGLALAAAIVQAAHGLPPDLLPRADQVRLDAPVVLFTLIVVAVTGFGFGLLPALQASAPAPGPALLESGRSNTSGAQGTRTRAVLIVVEAAIAAMLLVGAGLLVRSLQALARVDPGFPTARLLTFGISLPAELERDPVAVVATFGELRRRLAAIPGVVAVGMASRLPLSGADHSNGFRLDGEAQEPGREHSAQDRAVTPGYFKALGIPMLGGREFSDQDGATAPPVLIVNRAFAERYFPGADPIGQRVTPSRAGGMPREVVGVAGDSRQFGLDAPAEPEFYIPHAQDPWSFLNIVIRTSGDPAALLPRIQEAVWAIDRELPLSRIRTMEEMAAEGGAQRRLVTLVLTLFAGVAYLLAAIGLYGVLAYAVAQRTTEIGVRMALGATPGKIARMTLGRALTLAATGLVLGLAAAIPMTRWLRGLIYGVSETDPVTYAGIGMLLLAVSVAAAAIPTRRALLIDPASAMRAE